MEQLNSAISKRLCKQPPKKESYVVQIGTENMTSGGIFKQSMGARNRVGLGLSYRPARLQRPAEMVPWNRFLGSLKVKKFGSDLNLIIYSLLLVDCAIPVCQTTGDWSNFHLSSEHVIGRCRNSGPVIG